MKKEVQIPGKKKVSLSLEELEKLSAAEENPNSLRDKIFQFIEQIHGDMSLSEKLKNYHQGYDRSALGTKISAQIGTSIKIKK